MSERQLTMLWHEAGNPHYHDRFVELSKICNLTVIGPKTFQGKTFEQKTFRFPVKLFNSVLSSHWLTFVPSSITFYGQARRADILYVHEEPHSLAAFLSAVLRFGRPMYLESSAINLKGNLSGWNILERFVYRAATRIVPKNHEVADVLEKRGAPRHKIASPIGNGVSKSSFSIIEKSAARAALAQKYPQVADALQQGGLVLGYAGRIWQPKGIEILAQLAKELPVTILACGPVEDDYLVDALGSAGVTVLPSLQKDDLRTFYSALDLFILPSLSTKNWREQFGRVCIEAIYCGTPAVGSHVGGIPMVIGASQTFEAGNIEQAKALLAKLSDETERAQILQWQTAHVDQNFSWKAIAEQVLAVTHT
jgi:glycosyltransferase involved in cell wall biosynthesis